MKYPKGTMTSLFKQLAGKTYVDVRFARRIAECGVAEPPPQVQILQTL